LLYSAELPDRFRGANIEKTIIILQFLSMCKKVFVRFA